MKEILEEIYYNLIFGTYFKQQKNVKLTLKKKKITKIKFLRVAILNSNCSNIIAFFNKTSYCFFHCVQPFNALLLLEQVRLYFIISFYNYFLVFNTCFNE